MRPIKPEIWQSRDFRALSSLGRLAFICLISNADDEGRLKTDAGHLAETFLQAPSDAIQTQLFRMEELGMVITYERRGTRYLALRNWLEHQAVPHPKPSELPQPPKFKRGAKPNKGQFEFSFRMQAHEKVALIPNGTQTQTKPEPELSLSADVADPVKAVFAEWLTSTHKTARTLLDAKRRAVIRNALSVYPLVDVLDAVQGWQAFPHNRGENDRHREFNDLELLLRDSAHIELFRDAQRGLGVTNGERPRLDVSVEADLRSAAALREIGR